MCCQRTEQIVKPIAVNDVRPSDRRLHHRQARWNPSVSIPIPWHILHDHTIDRPGTARRALLRIEGNDPDLVVEPGQSTTQRVDFLCQTARFEVRIISGSYLQNAHSSFSRFGGPIRSLRRSSKRQSDSIVGSLETISGPAYPEARHTRQKYPSSRLQREPALDKICPACPIWRRRSGSASNCRMAFARATASPTGVSSPVWP